MALLRNTTAPRARHNAPPLLTRNDTDPYLPMNEAIAAVVFDLDAVLVDSETVWDAARREVVTRNGGRWQDGAQRATMGMSSREWSRYLPDAIESAAQRVRKQRASG